MDPPPSRITSYNVCYTKLLRTLAGDYVKNFDLASGNLFSGRILNPDSSHYNGQKPALDALGSMLDTGESYEIDLDSRITSYNVCYTKLLRL